MQNYDYKIAVENLLVLANSMRKYELFTIAHNDEDTYSLCGAAEFTMMTILDNVTIEDIHEYLTKHIKRLTALEIEKENI